MSRVSDIAKILVQKNGLKQADADAFVKSMFEVIADGLDDEKQVKVRDFGTFKVLKTKDRESVNVNTGERIVIEGREKINFSPDNILKEIVNRPFAQFETVVVNEGVDFSEVDKKYESGAPEDIPENKEEAALEEVVVPVDTKESSIKETSTETEVPAEEEESIEEERLVETGTSANEEVPANEEKTLKVETSTEEVRAEEVSSDEGAPANEEFSDEKEKSEREETPVTEMFARELNPVKDETTSDTEKSVSRKIVYIFGAVAVVLLVGVGILAYNYGKVSAERDHLLSQLQLSVKPKIPTPQKQIAIKVKQDSASMMKPAKAVEMAEKALKSETERKTEGKKKTTKKEVAAKPKVSVQPKVADQKYVAIQKATSAQKKTAETKKIQVAASSSKYDSDPRVRTGAYRITGVARTVKVRSGQTIKSISRANLGPGMECYVEALNGNGPLKEGQIIKIPELQLKKKK